MIGNKISVENRCRYVAVDGIPSASYCPTLMAHGKVKWFNVQKGYGFISQDSGPDILVHHTSIVGNGFKVLQEGELVSYEVVQGDKGLKAQNVQRNPSAGRPAQ